MARFSSLSTAALQLLRHISAVLWKDHLNRVMLCASFVIVLAALAPVIFIGPRLAASEEVAALRYNIYFGVDLVGNWLTLFLYPFCAIVMLCAHSALAILLYKNKKLMSHLVMGITPIFLFLNFLTLFFVIILNLEFIRK